MALDLENIDGIAQITINRPPVNAITLDIYAQIGKMFDQAENWKDAHCIIFTGAGTRAFCAGLISMSF